MAGLTPRRIWALVVPSVIVIISLFWFRKKRKIKDHAECASSNINREETSATSSKNSNEIVSSDCKKTSVILISNLSEAAPLENSNVDQCTFISRNVDNVIKPIGIAGDMKLESSSAALFSKSPAPVCIDDKVDNLQDISKLSISEAIGDHITSECKKDAAHKSNHIFIDYERVHAIENGLLDSDSRSLENMSDSYDPDDSKTGLEEFNNDLRSLNEEQSNMLIKLNTKVNCDLTIPTEDSDWKQFSEDDTTNGAEMIGISSSSLGESILIAPKPEEMCSSILAPESRIPEELVTVCNKNSEVKSVTDISQKLDESLVDTSEKCEISVKALDLNHSGMEIFNLEEVCNESDESCTTNSKVNNELVESGASNSKMVRELGDSCVPNEKMGNELVQLCSLKEKIDEPLVETCAPNEKMDGKVIEICTSSEKAHNGNIEVFSMNGNISGRNAEIQSSSDETQSWSDEVQSLSDEVQSSSDDVLTSCDEVPCSNNGFQCGDHTPVKPKNVEEVEVGRGDSEVNIQITQLHSPQSSLTLEENGILNSPLSTASISDLSPFSPTVTVEEEPMSLISADASSCANDEVDELRSQDDSTNNVNDTKMLRDVSELLDNEDHFSKLSVLSEGATGSKTLEALPVSTIEPIFLLDASDEPSDVKIRSEDESFSMRMCPSQLPTTIYDIPSEGSVDSEKGSETTTVARMKCPEGVPDYCVYEFELPQELCGRLIGKHGKHVKYIKERSNANVFIKRHPYNPQLKLAVVEGTQSDVNNALELIRKKYPPTQFAHVTLAQTNVLNSLGFHLPESLQLHLPEGVSCNVILSSLVTAGHFFLQQPTHHTYPSLSTLDQCMMACYTQLETPQLPQPVEAGVICAATIMNGWFRAQVVYVYESGEECDVKFVDYGGFSQVPISSLRQIRSDFMSLPFQASECYLANVKPVNEELGWSPAASATFEELAQGQILHAVVVDYTEDGNPYVHLYRVQGVSSTFINRELVDRGFALWVEHH